MGIDEANQMSRGHSSVLKREFFGAGPKAVRGYGVMMDASPTHFAYCSSDHVVIRSFEKPHQCEVYRGHASPTAVRFCPCEPLVCSGGADGVVKIWSLADKALTRYEGKHFLGKVCDIAWSPDGQRILLVGEGKGLYATLIMADGGSKIADIEGFTAGVISCDLRPTAPMKMVLASNDRRVALLAGLPVKEEWWREEMDVLTRQARFSPDGKLFVLAGAGKCLIYDADSGQRCGELPREHEGTVCSVCWSPDSTSVLTASCDQTVKMWDVAAGRCVQTFRFSDDSDVKQQQLGVVWGQAAMISAGLDGNLNILDPTHPTNPTVIPALCTPIDAMAVDYDTQTIFAAASCEAECKVVAFKAAKTIDQLYSPGVGAIACVAGQGPKTGITGLAIRNGKMAAVSMDGSLSIADVTDPASPRYICQVNGLEIPTKQCELSSAGVVVVATASHLALHPESNGYEQLCSIELDYTPCSLALHPSETEISVSSDLAKHRGTLQHIHLYSLTESTIQLLAIIQGTKFVARALSYSPDGQYLAAGDDNREVRFYNRDKDWAAEIEDYSFHGGRITSLTWHPSGDRCVSGALDRGIVVHKLNKLKRPAVFERANAGAIGHIQFINEDLFVTGGTDGTLTTYEFKSLN